MDVSIIIVNYNTKRLTSDCIDSVFNITTNIIFEVILVDNNSSDGSVEYFQNDNRIIFIKNELNFGFGKANNKGLERANGKYVFFLNSDTILLNNAVCLLFNYLRDNKNVGIVGGNLFDSNLKPTHSYRKIFPNLIWELNDLFSRVPERIFDRNWEFNHSQKAIDVAYITGADIMIRKSILDQVGGFNERFFMYFEDAELCFRVKKASFRIVSLPNAKIQHFVGQSLEMSKIKISLIQKSHTTYQLLTLNKTNYYICQCVFFLSASIRFMIFSVIGKRERAKLWKEYLNLIIQQF